MTDDLLAAFVTDLRTRRGLKARTCDLYLHDVGQYLEFLDGGDPRSATAVLIQQFLLALARERLRPATLRRKYAALRAFYAHLSAEGAVVHDPTDALIPPTPVVGGGPPPLTPAQVERLLAPEGRDPIARRDLVVRALLYATAMGMETLAALNLSDLGDGEIVLGGRCLPLDGRTWGLLVDYLREGRPALLGDGAGEAVFLSRDGRPLGVRSLQEALAAAGVRLLGERLTGRRLQQSADAHLLATGMDLTLLQALTGRAPAAAACQRATTERPVRRIYDRAHPRAAQPSRSPGA